MSLGLSGKKDRAGSGKDDFENEDVLIERMDSRKLAKHLLQRHSTDFWAYLNLTLSTTTVSLLGAAVRGPTLLNWILGWSAAEVGQIYVFLQCWNLYRVFKYHPRVFHGWFGRLALILNTWSFASIGSCVWASLNARNEFSAALREQKIEPISGKTSSKYSYLLSLIPLFLVSRRGKQLRYRRDIRYADMEQVDPKLLNLWKRTPPGVRNVLSLLPRGRISSWLTLDVISMDGLENAPIYVHIHGGGWVFGSKDHGPFALAERIASRGVVVCMVNYRLSPDVAWPAHIEDCKRALIYIKKHAREFGGDPNKVFVGGESAGGHLSAMMGATPNLPEFQPKEDPLADTSVAGSLPIYGIFDFCDEFGHHKALRTRILDAQLGVRSVISRVVVKQMFSPETKHLFEMASPVHHIRSLVNADTKPEIGPFFIPHGTEDALAAYKDSQEFYDALQKLRQRWGTWTTGETDVFITVTGGLHAFGYFPSNRAHAMGDAMSDFVFHHSKRIDIQLHQPQQNLSKALGS